MIKRKKWPWMVLSAAILLILAAVAFFPFLQRAWRALTHTPDENGFYQVNGYTIEALGDVNEKSLSYFTRKLTEVADGSLTPQNRLFYCVVPDKAYYTQGSGYPAYPYGQLFSVLQSGLPPSFQYIDITGCLSLESYYRTDSHWRQELLFPAAAKLAGALGFQPLDETAFSWNEAAGYRGGYARRMDSAETETLYYLESVATKAARVYNAETGLTGGVYDTDALDSDTPYNVFLSGPAGFLRVENEFSETEKELVVFRDSYAGSLIPLLLGHYRAVTLIDLRYLPASLLAEYITFTDQDVLFLYSTFLINKSMTLR